LILSSVGLPGHPAMLGNVSDVLVALRIFTVHGIFRPWDYKLDIKSKPGHQPSVNALAVIGAVRQKTLHIDVNIGKQIWESRFVADIF
jgi:hypothetical protein